MGNTSSKKILFLSHKFYPDIGGIEINSEILAQQFHTNGCRVHLVTWSEDVKKKQFSYKVIRNPNFFTLIKEHMWADLIFENNPSIRLVWPNFFLKRPLITVLHTWINRVNGKISWKDKFKLKRLGMANQVIACSNAIKSRCWPSAIVINNPYQDEIFKVIPYISKKYDFVFLGRLVSDKGVNLAIRAVEIIISKNLKNALPITISLTIIGDGPERKSLEELVSTLRLEKNIKFTGALSGDKLVRCLNEHRFIIVPSLWEEPFGMVALEGMGCGCVPIVSDGGGLPEAICNAGLIFKRGNIDSLVSRVRSVLNDHCLEQKFRNAAPAQLKKHYQDVVAGIYLHYIEEALSNDK